MPIHAEHSRFFDLPLGALSNRRSTAVNLEHVAKLAGVSRSTVSRVINNDPAVSEETRARVERLVQELNFYPNIAARGLAAGRTRVLGLVIPMAVSSLFSDPYFPLLVQGVSSACTARDHSVMLWLAEPEYERRTLRQILHNGLVDGVLVASQRLDDPVVDALVRSSLPFVLIGRHPSNENVTCVDVDNVKSARAIVAHLLGLGRRRIATIAGPTDMIAGLDRLEGYRLALDDQRLAVDADLIAQGDFTETGGNTAMKQLLPHSPDAVFCASDAMAVGALRALAEAGRRVPEEVAVAGFDDMTFAARTQPPLTTVHQPITPAGALAAETLIGMVEGKSSASRRILLPTELVIRASSGGAGEKRLPV